MQPRLCKRLAGLLLGLALAGSASAQDLAIDLSANLGFTTNYVFRGIEQNSGEPSGFFGLDAEAAGFYAGTWATNVDTGLEYDLYGGYIFEAGPFSIGGGYTGFFYTDEDFSDTIHEGNIYASYTPTESVSINLEQTFGVIDGDDGDDDNYSFTAVSIEWIGFGVLYGFFGDDLDGDYIEAYYVTPIAEDIVEGVDVGIHLVASSEDLLETVGESESDEYILFTLTKTFDL